MDIRSVAIASLLVAGFTTAAQAPVTLQQAYKTDFYIGAAINTAQITGQDARGDALITTQFNSISPENALKWENIHPQPGRYDFALADQYVAFGQKHHMWIVGHNLVWHSQTPA
jgi:endo-1,4-beta-xylanase